jgi:CheY-like chemotaxis protein
MNLIAKKILIVEDDPFVLDMYTTKLKMNNITTIQSDNGKKALEVLEKEVPDLILLDIVMPHMDGFELLSELKQNQKTKNIPVILLSNLGQKDDIEKGLRLGAEDYIVKAKSTPTEVVRKVKSLLKI